jgi:CRISPR-associated endonuclease/helicase Cas3
VDFPVVYRAEAGLDQIAQAAGRCNREGRRTARESRVFVFAPAEVKPPKELEQFSSAARRALLKYKDDPLSLEAIQTYFRRSYWLREGVGIDGLDEKRILALCEERADTKLFPFATITERFRLIEDGMLPILIPFDDEAWGLLKELETTERVSEVARCLQPYVVQVYPNQFARLRIVGAVQPVQELRFGEQFCALGSESLYRDDVGLTWEDPTYRAAEANIIDVSSYSSAIRDWVRQA